MKEETQQMLVLSCKADGHVLNCSDVTYVLWTKTL